MNMHTQTHSDVYKYNTKAIQKFKNIKKYVSQCNQMLNEIKEQNSKHSLKV